MIEKLVIGGGFVVFGGVMVAGAVHNRRVQRQRVRRSQPTTATVEKIRIEKERKASGSGPGKKTIYKPKIRFRYEFDGREYTGDDVYPGTITPTRGSESAAREVVDEIDVGDEAEVYVDPKAPDEAFLYDETTSGTVKLIGVGGAVFLLVGLGTLAQQLL